MVKNKKIVVLGGFGFLGKHVVAELKKNNYDSICLSRRNGYDIMNFPKFASVLKEIQPDTIINCAAHVGSVHYVMQYSADIVSDNMLIINNIYEAVKLSCLKTKIINPISVCSYPGEADIYSELDWQKGSPHESVIPYASTRRMIHAYSDCYFKQYKIKTINWIIANAYGPGDSNDPRKVHALNGIIIRMIKAQKLKNKFFEIWGSGKPIREWVYMPNVAKILVDSIKVDNQIYPINFAQTKAYSITKIAEIIAKQLKYSVKFVFNRKYVDGNMRRILDDHQFRKKYPNWKFTTLNEGIKKTINYYRKII